MAASRPESGLAPIAAALLADQMALIGPNGLDGLSEVLIAEDQDFDYRLFRPVPALKYSGWLTGEDLYVEACIGTAICYGA